MVSPLCVAWNRLCSVDCRCHSEAHCSWSEGIASGARGSGFGLTYADGWLAVGCLTLSRRRRQSSRSNEKARCLWQSDGQNTDNPGPVTLRCARRLLKELARPTRLELATSGVTGSRALCVLHGRLWFFRAAPPPLSFHNSQWHPLGEFLDPVQGHDSFGKGLRDRLQHRHHRTRSLALARSGRPGVGDRHALFGSL